MSNIKFYIDTMALHKEVTGSCILNIIRFPNGTTKRFLVDCGLFQENDYYYLNSSLPFNASELDYVLVTHNHVDHTGRLPCLINNGYKGKIHTSKTSAKIIGYALGDSYKVLKTRQKISGQKQLYTHDDVDQTINQVEGHEYEKSFYLDSEKNIKVTFFMNGHLAGASIILLQVKYKDNSGKPYEPINMLFTGDYNNKNIFFDPKPLPNWVYDLPITITQEATYGAMNSSEIKYVFESNMLKALENGKEILLPVFSLGRAQEILYILKNWQHQGKLDKSIPIYFDGMLGMQYNRVYLEDGLDNRPECKNFLPENFHDISGNNERRRNLSNDGKQKIVVATGGMCTHGPSQSYIAPFLRNPNALIHLTGYCAEDTLGRKIYNAMHGEVVSLGKDKTDKDGNTIYTGPVVTKLADVEFTSELSAHAKGDELIDFLRPFNKIQLVIINHGSYQSMDTHVNNIVKQINPKDVCIHGSYVYRLDGYGLIKFFSTKFS